MSTQQNKKVTFEPKLLIFEGTEVSQPERRALSQQQAFSDLYSGRQDVFMMNSQPIQQIENSLELQNGADLVGNYGQFYQGQQNFQIGLQQPQNLDIVPQYSYSQLKKPDSSINQAASERNQFIKQSKSLNDVQNSSSFQLQQQQVQPGQGNKLPARNDSAGSLSKQQNNSNNNLPISSIKSNVKNTYIKKISSLMTVQQLNGELTNEGGDKSGNIKEEMRESDDEDQDDCSNSKSFNNKLGDDSNDNKRLKKNRESARNSRQRKKIYIDLLEKKVSELNKSIEEVCVYIDKSQDNISQILEKSPFLRGLVQERLGLIEKIQKNIYEPKPNEEDLNLICDSFRLRLGATGRIRQHAIMLFFKHMYKVFLENNYWYFLYSYDQNSDDEDDEFNRCVDIFKDTIGLPENDNQIYSALPILKKFLEHRKQFKKLFKEMKNHQKEWQIKSASVENLVDKISPLLSATQVGKLIDFIDKRRKQPELQWMKKKYTQNTTISSSIGIGTTLGTSPPALSCASPANNFTSNMNPPMMTPSQILQASSALGNNFGYQNNISQIKNAPFQQNQIDFPIDPNHANQNLLEDTTQNFYNQLQFQNYKMYNQMFNIQQTAPYFGANSNNLDSTQNGQLPVHLQNHLSGQIPNHLSHQNISQHQMGGHLSSQHLHQGMISEQLFQNSYNLNQSMPAICNSKEELKQRVNSGLVNNNPNSDAYYIQEGVQKKRKQY